MLIGNLITKISNNKSKRFSSKQFTNLSTHQACATVSCGSPAKTTNMKMKWTRWNFYCHVITVFQGKSSHCPDTAIKKGWESREESDSLCAWWGESGDQELRQASQRRWWSSWTLPGEKEEFCQKGEVEATTGTESSTCKGTQSWQSTFRKWWSQWVERALKINPHYSETHRDFT